ncbi:hypothetical protein EIN_101130 [Entamoeba invadens IP1]|uniref:Uncharacterized protein n=1 Tax=Entamoeba invadens IP1 TaxID=370355 RepID=L7FJ72_ENTIV|nr:hypothetical protein EIN_101130 [Entamoeba invadens IP1]ELP83938.1 hypothetical protein EIN_101130 [Entamoeba invadens IP1]|eukprot:XP_004183284.1 hypothetical protein EIN_101130 [Entamoeba invadens IP1]
MHHATKRCQQYNTTYNGNCYTTLGIGKSCLLNYVYVIREHLTQCVLSVKVVQKESAVFAKQGITQRYMIILCVKSVTQHVMGSETQQKDWVPNRFCVRQ